MKTLLKVVAGLGLLVLTVMIFHALLIEWQYRTVALDPLYDSVTEATLWIVFKCLVLVFACSCYVAWLFPTRLKNPGDDTNWLAGVSSVVLLMGVIGLLHDSSRTQRVSEGLVGTNYLTICVLVGMGLMIMGLAVYLLKVFLRRPTRKNIEPTVSSIAIIMVLVAAMAYLPSRTSAGQVVVTNDVAPIPIAITFDTNSPPATIPISLVQIEVPSQPGMELVETSDLTRSDLLPQTATLKGAVERFKQTGQTQTELGLLDYRPNAAIALACVAKIILVLVVIGGIIYVGYLIYKACLKIKKNLDKKEHDDDDTQPPPQTNYGVMAISGPIKFGKFSSLPEGAQMYCAAFVLNAGIASVAESTNCDCEDKHLSIAFTASTNSPVTAYIPTNLVSEDDYFASRGLTTTNFVAYGAEPYVSYSYNGQPTNRLDEITRTSDGMFSFNVPGRTNVNYTIYTSTNYLSGTWSNSITISVPQGAKIKGRFNSPSDSLLVQPKLVIP